MLPGELPRRLACRGSAVLTATVLERTLTAEAVAELHMRNPLGQHSQHPKQPCFQPLSGCFAPNALAYGVAKSNEATNPSSGL